MAWKKKQEENMTLQIWCFKNEFEAYYNRWNGVRSDDRGLFCRLYEIVIEEMENMKKVKSNFINCAFNRQIEKEEEMMRGIVGYFTGQLKRGYGDEEPTYHQSPEAIA